MGGNHWKRDRLGALGIDGRIILKRTFSKHDGVKWIHLAQSKDKWRAAVNTAINSRVAEQLLGSDERICSTIMSQRKC